MLIELVYVYGFGLFGVVLFILLGVVGMLVGLVGGCYVDVGCGWVIMLFVLGGVGLSLVVLVFLLLLGSVIVIVVVVVVFDFCV